MIIDWYKRVAAIVDSMSAKARDAYLKLEFKEETVAKHINSYLKQDYETLKQVWCEQLSFEALGSDLGRHISFGQSIDYVDILSKDLPRLCSTARDYMAESLRIEQPQYGFENLLHPEIIQHALPLYRAGHLREAVHTAMTAIFDLIRSRTGIDADGAKLVAEAFSLENPKLIFSELASETGKSDQKGFIQILQGAYAGIRNPKAHSLVHDLDERKAAEYLVFASLLARRVTEASVPGTL